MKERKEIDQGELDIERNKKHQDEDEDLVGLGHGVEGILVPDVVGHAVCYLYNVFQISLL